MGERDERDFRFRAWDRHLGTLVADLRALADSVERAGRPHAAPGVTGTGRFTSAAEQVNHTIAWGVANASAYRLIETAFHADAAEREGVTP